MELYFIATAAKHRLDLFETQMQTMPFLWDFKTAEGKKMKQPIYGILQPIQLYRYVFPKEYLNNVLATLGLGVQKDGYKQFDKQAFALRKILKADPIPIIDPKTPARFFNKDNVALKGIGIKEDSMTTDELGRSYEGI